MFCRNEFYPADLLVAPTQDLRKRDDASLEESGMAVVEEEEEQEEEETDRQQRKALPRRAAAKYDYPEGVSAFPLIVITNWRTLQLSDLLFFFTDS